MSKENPHQRQFLTRVIDLHWLIFACERHCLKWERFKSVSKCETDSRNFKPSRLPNFSLPTIKDRIVPRPRCSYACVYIFGWHTHTFMHILMCICLYVCVCLYDINPSRKYKRVSSAAIQSPPPPLGLSTPNIMSFILSVKIINYYDRWLISSLDFEQTVTVFFSRPKNICTFSNKIDALSPHCFLNVKCICNDTRCLMYRYVRSIKITKLQHAVVLSENWSHFVHFPTRQKLEEEF